METVDDVFYEDNISPVSRWRLKQVIIDQLHQAEIKAGDKLFIKQKHYSVSVKKIDTYIKSLGASLTTDINKATKILNDDYWRDYQLSFTEKPKEIPYQILHREKYLNGYLFPDKVHEFHTKANTVLGVSEEAFTMMWNMLKNCRRQKENGLLAAGAIMKTNWTGSEYLLHAMVIHFHSNIRELRLSNVNGWSKFAKAWSIIWPAREVSAQQFMRILGKYSNTEQIQLVNKLISIK